MSLESNDRIQSNPHFLSRALRIEWIGQMIASICWAVSVFVYGLKEAGDYLQLAAAIAWIIANLAALGHDSSSEAQMPQTQVQKD